MKILLFLFHFSAATCLFAAQAGKISGCVNDDSGNFLPGVTIELGAVAIAKIVTFTDEKGCYKFDQIPQGQYRISFQLNGFKTATKEHLVVLGGQETVFDQRLQIAVSEEMTVVGRRPLRDLVEEDNLIGVAESASEGAVRSEQLALRPLLRPADFLESVPGVVISQHSGQGKANQFYLRGYNLDHGTDLAVTVSDIPVNLRTHAHGQGYIDLSFLIPELVNDIQFKKGSYSAEEGDFSAAGAIRIDYANEIERPLIGVEAGSFEYGRGLIAGSPKLGNGNLLYAMELFYNNGPWENPDHYRKLNGLLRYSFTEGKDHFNLTGMIYDGKWDATDQIARRSVPETGRFGAIDPTDGGQSTRGNVSALWQHAWGGGVTESTGHFVKYGLNLFSNFTYFLDDPVNGDQFEQEDRRTITGFQVRHRWLADWGRFETENAAGIQFRNDTIDTVGLFQTKARQRISTIRQDRIGEQSWSLFYENRLRWTDKVRTVTGIRTDLYSFDVESNLDANSGKDSDTIWSPKFSLILGPWQKTEYYFNFGYGFHSNDARGITTRVDPKTFEPVQPADPLVRARGTEFGLRTGLFRRWQSSFALWFLDLDSELLFVGDAGGTEATRPSRRVGFEWTNYFKPANWLAVDISWADTRARFRDDDPAGNRIPGAVEGVLSAGITMENLGLKSGSFRHTVGVIRSKNASGYQQGSILSNFIFSFYLRYFGPRPLIEDNSVRSRSSTLANMAIGYKISKDWNAFIDFFNLFDSQTSDVDYFYTSRLPGEPSDGIEDVHFHPVEPLSVRFSITKTF